MPTDRPSVAPGLCYRDPRAALAWLEKAFGFETTMIVEMPDGSIGHAEMKVGDGVIMVGGEYDARHKSPASTGGINTQSVHVQLQSALEAHCARAREAGAEIFREPADQFYGDRLYAAYDLEGHQWTFAQTIVAMSRDEMARAGGVAVTTAL